jgi:hypothetical protein
MARFESTCSTPTLASKAVAAAKAADSSAHPIQLIGSSYAARAALKVKGYIFSSIRNDSLLLARSSLVACRAACAAVTAALHGVVLLLGAEAHVLINRIVDIEENCARSTALPSKDNVHNKPRCIRWNAR